MPSGSLDGGSAFVDIKGAIVEDVAAAIFQGNDALLAEKTFFRFYADDIFFADLQEALTSPFDISKLFQDAFGTVIEFGIVEQPLIGYGQLAIEFAAFGSLVQDRPGVDHLFAGEKGSFHAIVL